MPTKFEREMKSPVVRQAGMPMKYNKRSSAKHKGESAEYKSGYGIERKRPVDLDLLGVHRLVAELTSKYNQNNDVGIVRSWFRKNKIEGQEKHFQALGNLVQEVRLHTSNLVEYKAELMTQQQRMEDLILLKEEESQFAVDRQREEHQTFLSQEDATRSEHGTRQEREKLENERIEAENEKIYWDAQQNREKANLLGLRGKLIEKIIVELDFADINMKQVFVLIEMIKDTDSKADILTAEAQWENLKAETEIKREQVKDGKLDNKHKKWKFEKDREGYDEEL